MKITEGEKRIPEKVFVLELNEREKIQLQAWAQLIEYDYLPYDLQDFLAQLQTMDGDAVA
jgi:hypothetical protein